MKIAIIGAGISGLSTAYLLSSKHEVVVFEAGDRLGGHTATVDVDWRGSHYAIDTGFIVHNDRTYPHFNRLMSELGVETRDSEMSFSVSCDQTGLEYAGSNINTLFAQRKNMVSPYFLKMVRDIVRFNKEAQQDLESGQISEAYTLGDYLQSRHYSDGFIRHYLIPMGAAIWSASTKVMFGFPLLFFIRFFKNHGLLQVKDRPQWRTVVGGSSSYIEPLTRSFASNIRLSSAVTKIHRNAEGVVIQSPAGSEQFDQVVVACHSDQALAMLSDPSQSESGILAAIPYQMNDVCLHTDESLLPRSRRAWSSWNYLLEEYEQEQATLTYNMNILQGLDCADTFCVTLNRNERIDPVKVIGQYQYAHPVFTLDSVAAQQRWSEINGVNNTWFCGAYWRNGFHEDGVHSALRVAEGMGVSW
ncbi:MAG: FAD-dependent oxidoreductase [Pseudomonadales bacterium]